MQMDSARFAFVYALWFGALTLYYQGTLLLMVWWTATQRKSSLVALENAWQNLLIVGIMSLLPCWQHYAWDDIWNVWWTDVPLTFVYLVCVDLVNSSVHCACHKNYTLRKLMGHDLHHEYKGASTSALVGTHESWQALLVFTSTSVWMGKLLNIPLLTFLLGGLLYQTHVFTAHQRNRHPFWTALGLNDGDSHLVHHMRSDHNYGIMFNWFDRILGTYKSPDVWWTDKHIRKWNAS